jgi:AraC-like DNA-binding protein/mannose-6-phosphate isomerase-like protein (cupin superfamily)
MENMTPAIDEDKWDTIPSVLPRMNLSTSSDAMRSDVSWCRIISSSDETLSNTNHKHLVHELHYIYEGELRFNFDESIVCKPGMYIFIPSDVVHSIDDIAAHTRKLVIGFDISSRNEIIRDIFTKIRVPVARRETKAFHELAQAIMHKSAMRNLTTSVSIACIVHTLLLEIVDSLTVHTKNRVQHLGKSEDSRRINQVLSFINENVFHNIAVEDVAKALNLSVRQLSRICHRLFGHSVSQVITKIQLKEISALLIDSNCSIAEIAEITGFSSPYSFSRHFSHYTGVTPSSYRRKYEIQT